MTCQTQSFLLIPAHIMNCPGKLTFILRQQPYIVAEFLGCRIQTWHIRQTNQEGRPFRNSRKGAFDHWLFHANHQVVLVLCF